MKVVFFEPVLQTIIQRAARQDAPQQKEWFLQRKSKLKKAVVSVLGERAARPFLIQTVEVDGRAGYVIGMEPGNIVVG